VFPSQVEARLRQMAGVEDVAVVGVSEGDLGERVVAVVVPREGADRVTLKSIQEWCDKELARYALPRKLAFVSELPRSQVGKVLRRVVKEQILSGQIVPA